MPQSTEINPDYKQVGVRLLFPVGKLDKNNIVRKDSLIYGFTNIFLWHCRHRSSIFPDPPVVVKR